MAHEQDRVTCLAQSVQQAEEQADLVPRQEDGGLVEDEDLTAPLARVALALLATDRADHGDHGALHGGEHVDRGVEGDVDLEAVEQLLDPVALARPMHAA